jgi:hypothetical protein
VLFYERILFAFLLPHRIAFGMESETQLAFDVSIFDRIHALFSSPFVSLARDGTSEQEYLNELSPNSQRIVQSKSEIKILSECLKFILVIIESVIFFAAIYTIFPPF